MRNSNLVVRLSDSERQMVDGLQEVYAINISQYVRNKLMDLDGIVNEGNNVTTLPIHLNDDIKGTLKKLREEFHCDPLKILRDAMDDEIIKDTLKANVLAIYDGWKMRNIL